MKYLNSLQLISILLTSLLLDEVHSSTSGVIAIGLSWELESENPIPGVETPITINSETLFTDTSSELDGDGLWRMAIYGSDNGHGSGTRNGEHIQILNPDEAATPFNPGDPVDIDGITTNFDIGSVGCTDELTHICVEFTKGDRPNPEYQFRTIDPDLGTEESLISCKELACGAKAIFTELNADFLEPDVIVEDNENKLVVDLYAIRHPSSTAVAGENLWNVKSYFSPNPDGRGPKYDEKQEVLTPEHKNTPLLYDSDLEFEGISISSNLEGVTCKHAQYFCMEVDKDAAASINYEFGTIPEQDPFVTCVDISDRCKGFSRELADQLPGYSYLFYHQPVYPRDCQEIFEQCSTNNASGVYLIKPDGYEKAFEVYCDNQVDGGGWTMFQRRNEDNTVQFRRTFSEYREGFGFLSGEFWLGNERLSFLTNQKRYQLRIDMTNSVGSSFYMTYDLFRISDEWSNYKLTSVGQYDGTADTFVGQEQPSTPSM